MAVAQGDKSNDDKSNGYEEVAETFMRVRDTWIGPTTVRQWSQILPRGCAILELGCGHGVVSQSLVDEGFDVYGIDASVKMIEAFRKRFPDAHAECSAVEDSEFFGRTFDAVVAWGLMFLLPPDVQAALIPKIARALNPGGKLLFHCSHAKVDLARHPDRTRVVFPGRRALSTTSA